jgi:hypothetical protein
MRTDQLLRHEQLVTSAEHRQKIDASYIDLLIKERLPAPKNVKEISSCLKYIVD